MTWAVADALLAAAPTAFEREAALRCWVRLDVPSVPGASGTARYGWGPSAFDAYCTDALGWHLCNAHQL